MLKVETKSPAALAVSLLALCLMAGPALAAQQTTSAATPTSFRTGPEKQVSLRQKQKAETLYLKGLHAIQNGNAEAAAKFFAAAVKEDPTDQQYAVDREIARADTATQLVQAANRARVRGNAVLAQAQLAQAAAMDPKNAEVAEHMAELRDNRPDGSEPTATLAPPIELAPKRGKQNFHIKGTAQEVAKHVLAAYGLNSTFDHSVGKEFIHFNADDVDFAQASEMLGLATDTFFVPLDPRSVLVAKDTKANHTTFDRMAVETLHLPGLSEDEMNHVAEVIRNVFGVQKLAINASSGIATVRATMPTIRALNRTLEDLLDGEDEVLLDVRLFTIAKTKTTNIGIQPPQTFNVFNVPSQVDSLISQNESLVQEIVSSGLANANDTIAIAAILVASGEVSSSVLSQPLALFGGGLTESGVTFSGVTANLSLNSSDTRALDTMQLRLKDQQEGTLKVGTRYPIETSTYSSIAASPTTIPGLTSTGLSSELAGLGISASSLASEEIPQVQYQDIGLTLTLTPRVQASNDVAINVEFKMTALEGSTINGLPVLNNTSFSADVNVLQGASALLVSDLTREESKALSGLPGLSDLPGFNAATDTETSLDLGDMIIVITPHLIRRRLHEELGPYIPLPRT